MGEGPVRHRVIVDTDALIAVANTSLWLDIVKNLRLTTTNVCLHELRRHTRNKSEYAPDGSRERWVSLGSQRALVPFEDETNDDFTVVTSVPRSHGEDAGEESVRQEVEQNPGHHTFVVLMDSNGRNAINRVFDHQDEQGVAVAPSYLLYLLYDEGCCSKKSFCIACGEMLRGERWTSYEAIQAIWEEIPIDCRPHLPSDLLP